MNTAPRPEPFFIGESPALDFLNTVATPKTVTFDWLETPEDLLDWLEKAGVAAGDVLQGFRAAEFQTELGTALRDITAFRERFRRFIQEVSAAPLQANDHPMIGEINALVAQCELHLQLAPTGSDAPYTLQTTQLLRSPSALLPLLASTCAKLIATADFRYVRNCEGPTCSLYFLDTSKNHKRRWCSMEVCGNRAKAAAFRKK